ncbi:hypothetical protein GCM10009557_50920 [Virgisporangium ochraceum]|uniref:Uncharacterized protein n=2 Tax=Virgisporangium ochraceum TaxID=65505 RepID=A0A8J4E8C4_9ACTN|nr:hypothetical protein Voc01_009420 [Virgisporangium ochraceum]
MVHKMLVDAFGAERLRDLPGDSGPRSGRFLLTQLRGLNTCFLYWDDAAMAVAGIVDVTCPSGGRPSAASVRASGTRASSDRRRQP